MTGKTTKIFVALVAAVIGSAVLLSAETSEAQVRGAGKIGIGIGSGTVANGLSLKYQPAESHAIQANVGTWGGGGAKDRYSNYHGLAVSADYLFLMPEITSGSVLQLAWNFGLGLGAGVDNDDLGLAGAFVAGLEFNFVPVPIDLTVEYRPTIGILPGVGFDLVDFTGHLRYHF